MNMDTSNRKPVGENKQEEDDDFERDEETNVEEDSTGTNKAEDRSVEKRAMSGEKVNVKVEIFVQKKASKKKKKKRKS